MVPVSDNQDLESTVLMEESRLGDLTVWLGLVLAVPTQHIGCSHHHALRVGEGNSLDMGIVNTSWSPVGWALWPFQIWEAASTLPWWNRRAVTSHGHIVQAEYALPSGLEGNGGLL